MENKKSFTGMIVESSIIVSSLLVFFGFLKQYWYYAAFNIEIQNYLSIDEVLIIFLGELPFLIKLFLGAIIYYLFLLFLLKVFCLIKDNKDKNSIKTEQEFNIQIDIFFSSKKNQIIIFIFSIILSTIGIVVFNYLHSEIVIIYLTLMLCQTIYVTFDIIEIGIDKLITNLILFIFSLTIMLYFKNFIDIKNVTTNTDNIKLTYLNVENDKVIKECILIGKTKEFLFLYDKSKNKTSIIKSDSFINLENKLK